MAPVSLEILQKFLRTSNLQGERVRVTRYPKNAAQATDSKIMLLVRLAYWDRLCRGEALAIPKIMFKPDRHTIFFQLCGVVALIFLCTSHQAFCKVQAISSFLGHLQQLKFLYGTPVQNSALLFLAKHLQPGSASFRPQPWCTCVLPGQQSAYTFLKHSLEGTRASRRFIPFPNMHRCH